MQWHALGTCQPFLFTSWRSAAFLPLSMPEGEMTLCAQMQQRQSENIMWFTSGRTFKVPIFSFHNCGVSGSCSFVLCLYRSKYVEHVGILRKQ